MERIDKILNHKLFISCLERNKETERDRIFCRHNMEHFLNVARIGEILNLEEHRRIPKVQIYAAALLHDIGRYRQYEDGTPHEQASAQLAPQILRDCGFDENETCVILNAIASHRDGKVKEEPGLRGILYRADKLSRGCFACEAEGLCDWKQDKKNRTLRY
ncbi:MAG: HD domain-containing protein [Lachnospiraceae bacterium]|nr:HD domain-containing protein [Lachnospiraceae bacterium]